MYKCYAQQYWLDQLSFNVRDDRFTWILLKYINNEEGAVNAIILCRICQRGKHTDRVPFILYMQRDVDYVISSNNLIECIFIIAIYNLEYPIKSGKYMYKVFIIYIKLFDNIVFSNFSTILSLNLAHKKSKIKKVHLCFYQVVSSILFEK